MGLLGTLLGGSIGFMMGGPLGAILGGAIGSNSAWRRPACTPARARAPASASARVAGLRNPLHAQQAFMIALISLAAKVAKADGQVTPPRSRASISS